MLDSLQQAFFWLVRNTYGLTEAELRYWARKSIDRQNEKNNTGDSDAVGGVCVVIPNNYSKTKPLCCPEITDRVECATFGPHAGGIGRIQDACPADAVVLHINK